MTKDIEREAFETWFKTTGMYEALIEYIATHQPNLKSAFIKSGKSYRNTMVNTAWLSWQAAKAQAVPEGFVLVKKRNMIGNPNVEWLQAPKWAKYWLKDGHSNKFWWSSIRPVKDMDMNAFCWKGDYFAKEASDFSYSGPWDKSLTSRKAMIEAQEPAND